MSFDNSRIEIVSLDDSHVAGVIRIAEILKETPHWSPDSYVELASKAPAVRRIALVARVCGTGLPSPALKAEPEIAGFVIARLVPPEGELESIGVAAEWQRRGIGRRLVRKLGSEMGKAGVETLHLEVRASNGRAIAFYRSLGFAETGSRPRYYADPIEDAVLMELLISSLSAG
jgi:[ribosomal protein S18]-alanine N-acetyltransferase